MVDSKENYKNLVWELEGLSYLQAGPIISTVGDAFLCLYELRRGLTSPACVMLKASNFLTGEEKLMLKCL